MAYARDRKSTKHYPGRATVHLDTALFRSLVAQHDLRCREIAEAIGSKTGYVQKMHSGAQTRISLKLARKIEAHFGCPGRLFTPTATDEVTQPEGA